MEKPHKRKRSSSAGSLSKRRQLCMIHYVGSNCANFTYIADSKDPNERFEKLKQIRNSRMQQPHGSNAKMDSVCSRMPNEITADHGYHRDCYQRFTRNIDRLKGSPDAVSQAEEPRKSRRSMIEHEKTIFNPDCIFCNKDGKKKIKIGGTWTTETKSTFGFGKWQSVLNAAEQKQDEKLLTRIRGHDLFACEAKYHRSCEKSYLQKPDHWRSVEVAKVKAQAELEKAHLHAYSCVSQFIDTDIIRDMNIVQLSTLREIYVSALSSTEYANPDYRSEKLKAKLQNSEIYSKAISFCKLDSTGLFQSYLVYSAKTDVESAIKCAYELGSRNMLVDVASNLRQEVLDAYQHSANVRWPPIVQELNDSDPNVIPGELAKFLSYVMSGRAKTQSTRVTRLISSIGQDICRAVTHGQWKMPKHIIVCMALRHMFRSAELTTMLHRLGHSESYTFSLELETAIAEALQLSSTLLTTQIVCRPAVPALFHSEFDNFDQLVNDLTGKGSIHTAHGIMLQDIPGSVDHGGIIPDLPIVERTNQRALKLVKPDILPECYVTQRKSPGFNITRWTYPGTDDVNREIDMRNLLWVLIRLHRSKIDQTVPAWTGFVSVTGKTPINLTSIDYYPVINQPITDYKTVQECLRYAEEATKEVGQDYTITTFDLGVCMKAYPIIWNSPDRYESHIVMIGTFHLACAYMKMLGKKMTGSGLSDIFLEADLIGSGSLQGVLNGKHYERAMHCHKTLLEALERLLFEQFISGRSEQDVFGQMTESSRQTINSLIQDLSDENIHLVLEDEHMVRYITQLMQYREDVRQGELGKTAQLWLSYMDHVWLVLRLIQAVKTNNFLLYAQCIHLMPDLFFSYDGQNYARHLTFHSIFIANIENTHPGASALLKRGAISVARSFIPGNLCAVDKTMEETFMKHAKSHGGAGGSGAGLSGLLNNYDSYQRWVRTTQERSKYRQASLNMADMLTGSEIGSVHTDLKQSQIIKSEKYVKRTKEAVSSFINPFNIDDKTTMYCISSGAPVPDYIAMSLLNAETLGARAKEDFVKNRLEKKENFYEPIKRMGLKTMGDMSKIVHVKAGKNRMIEYRQQGNIAFQLLVKSQADDVSLDLKHIMRYPLTPVPYSIATADGFFAKTDKAKGFHYLIKDMDSDEMPPAHATLIIQDGNALFHCMKQVPGNFKDICVALFDMLPKHGDVIVSTDMYQNNSIKEKERQQRGCAEKLLIQGVSTKKPADWSIFLKNNDNKEQLVQVMLTVWSQGSMAKKIIGRKVILVCGSKAHLLTSADGITTDITEVTCLESLQEETDTRVILYCLYAKERGYENIRIRSPDSDIFFILLHYISQLQGIKVLFDTGTGNKKKLLNISSFSLKYTEEHRTALMVLHAYTGCDSTSAFKGKGKIKPLKLLEKKPQFIQTLAHVGDSWDVPAHICQTLEEFTCAIYGCHRLSDINQCRHLKLKERCQEKLDPTKSIDMGSLPPCHDCLKQHIHRVNYQVGIWKRSHINSPPVPAPTDGHGWTLEGERLEPLWTDGDIIPPEMIDILDQTLQSENNSDDEYFTEGGNHSDINGYSSEDEN